jgi:hypothetical protein
MQINKEDLYYLFAFLFFTSFFLIFAISGYPLLGGDSYAFLPTAIHISRGEGLVNELYMPTGQKEMLYYPPLFPYFQSLLLFGNKINSIFISLSITSIATLGVSILIIRKLIQHIDASFSKFVLIFILLAGISTGLDISPGRPEILVNLLITLAISVYVFKPKWAPVYYGVLLTLIGLCSVVTGIYATLILTLLYIYNKENLKNYLMTIFSAIILFILFLSTYPYSFLDLISTLYSESQKVVFFRNDVFVATDFINYHITNPTYSFYFLLFLISVIIIFVQVLKSALQITMLACILALIYYFGFRNLAHNYNVYNLYLLYVFIILVQFKSYPRFKYILFFIFLLMSVGFTRRTFLYFYFYEEQATINSAFSKLKNYTITNFNKNTSLWPFMFYKSEENIVDSSSCSIYQQTYGNIEHNTFANIQVQNTRFESFKLGAVTIANNPPFYYYILVKND